MKVCPSRFALLTCAGSLALFVALSPETVAARDGTAEPGAATVRAPHAPAHQADPADSGEIVVVGHPPTNFGLLSATADIAGDELVANARGQIGEVLKALPGVSSTSFSPGASRPVLRGLGGDRVSVLTDGIGSLDASNVSVDHAVVFDTLTIDHIDVFHGPSVLLFGGNAIGGAVNAIDKRIPRTVPGRVSGTAIISFASAATERAASGAVDIPLGDRWAAHLDGSWRKSDDLRVGGRVYSPALRARMREFAAMLRNDGDDGGAGAIETEADRDGRIPNSAARTATLGLGLAFIDAGGSLGLSFQRTDTRYGVPARPATEPGQAAEEDVTIDLAQDRIDLRGELVVGGWLDRIQFRGAHADYRHAEMEGDEIGTVFDGRGMEARVDLVQADRGGWRGRSGVQYLWRTLAVSGAEAIVPDYTVERVGAFTLQSVDLGSGISLDGSGRVDQSRIASKGRSYARSFNLWSGAAGIAWQSPAGLGLGGNFVHGERAPSPEELLSDGAHVATQSYEVGNSGLGKERSNGFEAYVRYQSSRGEFSVTGYLTRFSNYIAPLDTGFLADGMPVYAYSGVDATFRGFEAQGSVKALEWDRGSITIDAGSDFTHARIRAFGPVPRIPALRLRGGAEMLSGNLRVRSEIEWNAAQKRVGAYEAPTASFTIVNLGVDWHPWGEHGPLTIMLAADNLFNAVGRRSASFTRDFVPVSGRDLRVTAKCSF